MRDFRDRELKPGDLIAYVGRQDLKASLNEARVERVGDNEVWVRCTRTSDPIGTKPTGKLVRLTLSRKIGLLRRGLSRCDT